MQARDKTEAEEIIDQLKKEDDLPKKQQLQERFWSCVKETPIISKNEDGTYKVLFIHQLDKAAEVRLDCLDLRELLWDENENEKLLEQIPGTDIYYLELDKFPSNTRIPYEFEVDHGKSNKDKRNPNSFNAPMYDGEDRTTKLDKSRTSSILSLPDSEPQLWSENRIAENKGVISKTILMEDEQFGRRPIWIYTPPDFDKNREEPYELMLISDGHTYINKLPPALDMMCENNSNLANTVVAIIGNVDPNSVPNRTIEYNRVLMRKDEPKIEEMAMGDLVALNEDGQLTMYWIEKGKVVNRSYRDTEVQSIAHQLPEVGQESTNLKLIQDILSQYDCIRKINPNERSQFEENRKYEFIDHSKEFSLFITEKILPTLQQDPDLNVSKKPEDTYLVGFSLGGHFTAEVGLNHSDKIGNLICLSGAFSNRNAEIVDLFKEADPLNLNVYLSIGTFEDRVPNAKAQKNEGLANMSRLDVSTQMCNALTGKVQNVTLEKFPVGHSEMTTLQCIGNGINVIQQQKQILSKKETSKVNVSLQSIFPTIKEKPSPSNPQNPQTIGPGRKKGGQ